MIVTTVMKLVITPIIIMIIAAMIMIKRNALIINRLFSTKATPVHSSVDQSIHLTNHFYRNY